MEEVKHEESEFERNKQQFLVGQKQLKRDYDAIMDEVAKHKEN